MYICTYILSDNTKYAAKYDNHSDILGTSQEVQPEGGKSTKSPRATHKYSMYSSFIHCLHYSSTTCETVPTLNQRTTKIFRFYMVNIYEIVRPLSQSNCWSAYMIRYNQHTKQIFNELTLPSMESFSQPSSSPIQEIRGKRLSRAPM